MTLNNFLNAVKYSPFAKRFTNTLSPRTKAKLRHAVDRVIRPSRLDALRAEIAANNELLALSIYQEARKSPRFQDPKRLLGSGFKCFSMHDEDGIIEEIFRRIGTTNRFFVEFGVGDGLENDTLYLILKGWSGAWIEGMAACYEDILRNMASPLEEKRLRVLYSFITRENIESLFAQLQVPREFDLLSIDIDRNDYWIWDAITNYNPRVVAIEYNASWMQTVSCTVRYDGTASWDWTNYCGASLKALERLGAKKGYSLVGCNYTGVTSFFVRNDLLGDKFLSPYTSENHFEPPRSVRMPNGHKRGYGPLVTIE